MTDFATRRTFMVDTQVRPSDVTKYPIIEAMLSIPRENFIPSALSEAAYVGENITVAPNRVVLEPRTLAKILDALEFKGDELVLDIGSSGGYSSAVVANMCAAVVALEEDEALTDGMQQALAESDIGNVVAHTAPLAQGAPEHGPYDVILIEGAIETLPDAIKDQLKEGGRIAAVFMEGALGSVRIGVRHGDHVTWRLAFHASAPVLPGFEKVASFVF